MRGKMRALNPNSPRLFVRFEGIEKLIALFSCVQGIGIYIYGFQDIIIAFDKNRFKAKNIF